MNSGEIRIRIIQTPQGPAPENIRSSWVGVELTAIRLPGGIEEVDFITGRRITEGNRGGYLVKVNEALGALGEQSPEGAAWFRKNLPPGMPSLAFGLNEIEILPPPQQT